MMPRGLSKKLNIGVLVHEVSRVRRKAIDRVLKPLGITGGQWWVLTYISLHDGKSQVELAEELNMGKVALGGLIDRLEAAGLLERRPDKVDRRVKRIHYTKSGRIMIEQIKNVSATVQEAALKDISYEDIETTIQTLSKMEDNILNYLLLDEEAIV